MRLFYVLSRNEDDNLLDEIDLFFNFKAITKYVNNGEIFDWNLKKNQI